MKVRISDGRVILDVEVAEDARLSEFKKHKKTILDTLRNAHARQLKSKKPKKSEPFDEDKAWNRLTGLASFYFRQDSAEQKPKPMTASKLVPRLHKLKKALREARTLVDEAMQDEVGGALYSSWCEANGYFENHPDGEPALAPVGHKMFDPVRTKNEFDKVSAGLATLEAAALTAADDVSATKRGRHPILSRDDVWNLATLYRDSTGSIPGAGAGPFAKFVVEVLTAQGRYNDDEDQGKRVPGAIKHEGVVDAIVDTRKWALTDPAVRKWASSPFEEEE